MKKPLAILFILYLLVLSVNISVNYSYYTAGGDWYFSVLFSLAMVTIGWFGYVLLYYGLFRDKLNWEKHPDFSFLLTVLLSGIYGVVIMCAAMKIMVATGILWQEKPLGAYVINSIYAALFSMMAGLIINGQNFLARWRKGVADNERMKLELLQARYAALKSQVNPHFFFNALNTLNNLIAEDAAMATDFVNCLSRVFRYSLQYDNEQTVALKEELTVTEDFLFIIKKRFGKKINILISISDAAVIGHIIGYALLTAVENAIKHNEISKEHPLSVTIRDEGAYLIISNNYQPIKTGNESPGMGLANISERYRLVTSVPVIVQQDTMFSVKIPLLSL